MGLVFAANGIISGDRYFEEEVTDIISGDRYFEEEVT